MWAIVSSLVGALVGSVIGPLLRYLWLKPRIAVAPKDEVVRETGVLYHRLSITNQGRLELRACAGSISFRDIAYDDVAMTPRRQLITRDYFRQRTEIESESLPWDTPGRGLLTQTINPKATAKLILYRVLLSDDGKPDLFQLPSEEGWEPLKTSLRPRELPYSGNIVISAANAERQQLNFTIVAAENDMCFVIE